MSHILDMQDKGSGYVSVGWLHPDHPFPQAEPDEHFLARLEEYVARCPASSRALGFGAAGGFHTCEFCESAHGTANFGVPFGDRIFYAPEMIVHYVEAHHYAPPAEFVAAVMNGPLPGTRQYVDAVASIVQRRRAEMADPTTLVLERHVALVLHDLLSRLSDLPDFRSTYVRSEQVAVWTVVAELEALLVEPFEPNYLDVLARAQRRVENYGRE
jgi:hypothetical protein